MLAALLLFWAVLLLFSPSFGKRHRLLEDHGRYHAAGNNLARPSMLGLFLAGVALCMGLTYCAGALLHLPAAPGGRGPVERPFPAGLASSPPCGAGWAAATAG